MKIKLFSKIISLIMVLATLVTAIPLTVFAEAIGGAESEIYIKSIKLVQAKTAEEAREELASIGYKFLDANLNEGTGEDGIWLGYLETTDASEALYDMKVMNMKGGFTITSVEEALKKQETAFAQMVTDLNYLIEEFVMAYEEGSVPAQKAYTSLNFFRVVAGETELNEENGLGYQMVHGGLSLSELTEIIMLCDSDIVDSIVKILTTGIQVRNVNWMEQLSKKGPYDSDTVYSDDEIELKRRAEQLLVVLQFYAEAYNAMDKSGLIPDSFDDNGDPIYSDDNTSENLPAEEAEIKKLDESRYKIYKVVFDELAKYKYGEDGNTLKDFFVSLASEGNAKKLYPLASILSDGEFAALSYGCFLEMAVGVTATSDDFDNYDEVYEDLTKEVKSLYIYEGVDKALLDEDAVIGFTDAASRHMASTGELEFYEKESYGENVWETGKNVAKCIGALGSAVIGVSKITYGVTMMIAGISSTVATSVKSGMLAGVMKFCTLIGGTYSTLVIAAVALLVTAISYIIMLKSEADDNEIDWENNPIPQYLYDVKEITLSQTSTNDGIATEAMRRSVYAYYEAVTDIDDNIVDMNAFSDDASQWNALYVSRDKQGNDAKPIKANDLLVVKGNGETPEGYEPLTAFGRVVPYNLNQWDDKDDVNGVYLFYKQDKTVSVESGVTYYIYDVYLQVGESDAHCIDLLESAGYTPLNVNLTPGLDDGSLIFSKDIYTYLGYKVTTNPNSAIRDIRIEYGPSQGEFKLGSSTYAECGSNGYATLYATKYKNAGTPILAGGIIHLNSRDDAPAGYEPVNFFSGGPATNINVGNDGIYYKPIESYLYFLPEVTFTEGTEYLSGISYISYNYNALRGSLTFGEHNSFVVEYLKKHMDWEYEGNYKDDYIQSGEKWIPIDDRDAKTLATFDFVNCKAGYDYITPLKNELIYWADIEDDDVWDAVMYSKTYNPYRAIYDLKGTAVDNSQAKLSLESVGYISWNSAYFSDHSFVIVNDSYLSTCYLSYDAHSGSLSSDLGARLYVSGNPSANNVYNVTKGEMSEAQPILIADFNCVPLSSAGELDESVFLPVTDVFTDSDDGIVFMNDDSRVKFGFYFVNNTDDRPYVSGVTAIDKLTLFRAYNSKEKVIGINQITDSMLLSQLANQGATNFNGIRVSMNLYSGNNDHEANALKFGYTRSENGSEALRDVFIYFSGFSADEAPKEIYRGSVKYTLLCEIPYNLSRFDDAAKVGVYLYGTTDSKAGNRIIDFEVSENPFKEGYTTVRTMNGGSLVSEILEYSEYMAKTHLLFRASNLYYRLYSFFQNKNLSDQQENGIFYLHIKREGDSLQEQKPYIGEIYVVNSGNKEDALEKLFHMGAEGYVDMELNDKTIFGDKIYLGYSYTADPDEAIREIRAYHKKNPPKTLTDESGFEYTLASDIDLNKGAGGDYIYLYITKDSDVNNPIIGLYAGNKVKAQRETVEWIDGTYVASGTSAVRMWNSDKYSDLNKGAGGSYVYLMSTNIDSDVIGSYKDPNYGNDKTYTRKEINGMTATGKYIGALYVMDKNTIRQEKLAAGIASEDCTCDKITDQEVFDRLKAMGATTVIETPIVVSGIIYDNNNNKVFIGYSRTNDVKKAIKNIALKAEIVSLAEPDENIEIDKKSYKLVAEAAKKVTELPRAINLIGLEDCQDMLMPRLYLYYSTAGSTDPIYDICIDSDPLKNDWNTARSANKLDPFADIYTMARDQYEHPNAIEMYGAADPSIIYTNQLHEWMKHIAEFFNPEDKQVTPFYIHCKKVASNTVEEEKPYIGEVFVASGESKHEALSKLVAFEPDGFIDCDLNQNAGGDYVYLAYKRVAKAKDALTDIVVFEGKNPSAINRLSIGESSVKYTLVADVDLNESAGGKYLYLYTSNSSNTGNPIRSLKVEQTIDSYLKCGVERVTVRLAEGKTITDEYIDLNKKAGGDYLYLIMQRDTREGHNLSEAVETLHKDPTCGDTGHDTTISTCLDCGAILEDVTVIPATGEHFDSDNDGDHKCDVCGKNNLTTHIRGEEKIEDRIEATEETDGSYKIVYYCTECHAKLKESKVIIPAGTPAGVGMLGASVLGNGSVVAIITLGTIAISVAVTIYFIKRKNRKVFKND